MIRPSGGIRLSADVERCSEGPNDPLRLWCAKRSVASFQGLSAVDLHRTLRFSSDPVIKESAVSGVFLESMMDTQLPGAPVREFCSDS